MVKTEILPIINRKFLLLTKRKTADKTLKQCFLKEFKATCKSSSESELNNRKQSEMKCYLLIGQLCS